MNEDRKEQPERTEAPAGEAAEGKPAEAGTAEESTGKTETGAAGENAKETAAADPEAARKAKLHRRHMRALRALLLRAAALGLVIYVLFVHIVGITVMPNGDMYPRIDAGDMVLYYRLERNIHAQDIIVFEKPTASLEQAYAQEEAAKAAARPEKSFFRKALDWIGFRDPADPPKTTFICRVVAGPGDTVEIAGERLLVNGNAVIESNIFYSTPEYEGFVAYPVKLGEGQYFVLADARHGGADSRFFGPVEKDEILGVVITLMRRNNL